MQRNRPLHRDGAPEAVPFSRLVRGQWFKHSSYEVVPAVESDQPHTNPAEVGPWIAPTAHAELETTKPWRAYEEGADVGAPKAKRRNETASHLALIGLGRWSVENEAVLRASVEGVSDDACQRALSFVETHGPLGILLHERDEWRLPGWRTSFRRDGPLWFRTSRATVDEGQCRSQWRSDQPDLTARDWVGSHFPHGVPAERDEIGGNEWLWHYAESVYQILEYAETAYTSMSTLNDATLVHDAAMVARYENLRRSTAAMLTKKETVAAEKRHLTENLKLSEADITRLARELRDVRRSTETLNQLTRDGEERLVFNETAGKLERRWAHGSLLSAAGYMIVLDVSRSASVRPCEFAGCINQFAAKTPRQRYCSDQCQNAATRRRQRARAKEAANV